MAQTFDIIERNLLTSSTTSVTFSNIPQTYTDLVVKLSLRTDVAANFTAGRMRFNSDTSTVYSSAHLFMSGASSGGSNDASNSFLFYAAYGNANNATASHFGNSEIYIPSYTDSNNKSYRGSSSLDSRPATTTDALVNKFGGVWKNTSAITSITIYLSVGNFVANSSFTLYGILAS